MRSVLDDVLARRASLPAGSTPRKLATFYGTCMDSATTERAGVEPIRPLLSAIDGIASRAALVQQIAELHTRGVDVAFRFGPDVGRHDAARYYAGVYQGGLGLPDRDYYFEKGAAADSTRRAYVAHVAKLLELAGTPGVEARRQAQRVLAFETKLAAASLTRLAQRDPIGDRPPHADRPRARARAARRLAGVLPGRRRHRADRAGERRHARVREARRQPRRVRPARRLAGVPALPRARADGAVAERRVRA